MAGLLRRNRYDLVVVGGGMAGIVAAWQAAMCGLSVRLVESALQPGGQIATAGRVEGMPGVSLSGPELVAAMLADASKAGVRPLTQDIASIEAAYDGFAVRHTDGFLLARNVLLSTGGSPRRLGLPEEVELEGRGIAHCATCDGPLCRGKEVVVVGGGDAALQEALLLSGYARSVTIIARGRLRARRRYLEQAETRANLRLIWGAEIAAIRGAGGVEGVTLRHTDGSRSGLACFALFAKIGSIPNSAVAGDLVDRTPTGHVLTDAVLETKTPGLFAAGAVRQGFGGDLLDAAADGALVARSIASRTHIP